MAHRGREHRQLRLDIDPGAVPPKQRMDGVAVAKIMNARKAARGCTDVGGMEEGAQAHADARAGVRLQSSVVAHEKRGVGGVPHATARAEVAVRFAGAVLGEGDEARLVELRCAHEQRALGRVVVGDDEADQLSATQAHRVEQHNRQAIHLGTQRRGGPGGKVGGDAQ